MRPVMPAHRVCVPSPAGIIAAAMISRGRLVLTVVLCAAVAQTSASVALAQAGPVPVPAQGPAGCRAVSSASGGVFEACPTSPTESQTCRDARSGADD